MLILMLLQEVLVAEEMVVEMHQLHLTLLMELLILVVVEVEHLVALQD